MSIVGVNRLFKGNILLFPGDTVYHGRRINRELEFVKVYEIKTININVKEN